MCLIDTRRFRFTFKRIPIYKVVRVSASPSGYYFSPYQSELLRRKCKRNSFKSPDKSNSTEFVFGKGFYHAFRNYSDAANLAFLWSMTYSYCCWTVVLGYIPPFTRYAIGQRGDICARRMILNI